MIIIGLTGSIATGKSTVANMFSQMRIPIYDADCEAHKLLASNGQAVLPVIQLFGAEMGNLKQGINRDKLGAHIFADPDKRQKLEAIIHPLLATKQQQFIAHNRRIRQPIIIFDIPLLFETNGDRYCDYVITVWTPLRMIKQRALNRSNMNIEKLEQILNAQLSQNEKKRLADLALPTALGHAETRRRLKKWLKQIKP